MSIRVKVITISIPRRIRYINYAHNGDLVLITLKLPLPLLKLIEESMAREGYKNRSEYIRELIVRGLQYDNLEV